MFADGVEGVSDGIVEDYLVVAASEEVVSQGVKGFVAVAAVGVG